MPVQQSQGRVVVIGHRPPSMREFKDAVVRPARVVIEPGDLQPLHRDLPGGGGIAMRVVDPLESGDADRCHPVQALRGGDKRADIDGLAEAEIGGIEQARLAVRRGTGR